MAERLSKESEYSEEHDRNARRSLEKAEKTLEEGRHSRQTEEEIKGVKRALASSERAGKESAKSHDVRERGAAQRKETERLMREADRELEKTGKELKR